MLVELASVVDAVRCAVAVRKAVAEPNTGVAADSRIGLRIGINLGDVIAIGRDPGLSRRHILGWQRPRRATRRCRGRRPRRYITSPVGPKFVPVSQIATKLLIRVAALEVVSRFKRLGLLDC
jgi:hypothetical protein